MEERDGQPCRLSLSCQTSVNGRCRRAGMGTHMAVTGLAINAGLGESALSEKGENAEIRALADDGCLKGERTANIMATHATGQRRWQGSASNVTMGSEKDFLRATLWCRKQNDLTLSTSGNANLRGERGSWHARLMQLDEFVCWRGASGGYAT